MKPETANALNEMRKACAKKLGVKENEYELDEFQSLIKIHDKVCGFNNIGFDDKVLATADVTIPTAKSYDILSEIYSALGSRQKGCKLENVVKANFPNTQLKTEDAAKVPVLWQQGYKTKVVDYCLNDVRMTKQILDRILRFGYINNPIEPTKSLILRRP